MPGIITPRFYPNHLQMPPGRYNRRALLLLPITLIAGILLFPRPIVTAPHQLNLLHVIVFRMFDRQLTNTNIVDQYCLIQVVAIASDSFTASRNVGNSCLLYYDFRAISDHEKA